MKTADLEVEHLAALKNIATEDAVELVEGLGISPYLVLVHQMVGILPVRLDRNGWQWEPDEDSSVFAYITPVRVEDDVRPLARNAWGAARMGELVDLIAWHPGNPRRWALRAGAVPWLGAVQYDEPFPATVRQGPQSWLQSDCDGLVLLTRDPVQLRSIVADFEHGVRAESAELAAELDRRIRQPIANLPRIASV